MNRYHRFVSGHFTSAMPRSSPDSSFKVSKDFNVFSQKATDLNHELSFLLTGGLLKDSDMILNTDGTVHVLEKIE